MISVALVKDSKVINTVLFEDFESTADFPFDEGVTPVELPENSTVSIGYSYDGEKFTPPEKTKEQLEYEEQQLISSNMDYKVYLMAEASQKVSILQDAVDLEMATDEESRALPLWKKYRVLLSRVNAETANDVKWPEKPV